MLRNIITSNSNNRASRREEKEYLFVALTHLLCKIGPVNFHWCCSSANELLLPPSLSEQPYFFLLLILVGCFLQHHKAGSRRFLRCEL
mmetsp:Transcript_40460/g.65972  ORF Transcript_40460/g.65972 Transcript_40460/m.65972 type:complete len:88 (-) Transcript_40460:243-506(-)